jgi:hypothetical protein
MPRKLVYRARWPMQSVRLAHRELAAPLNTIRPNASLDTNHRHPEVSVPAFPRVRLRYDGRLRRPH